MILAGDIGGTSTRLGLFEDDPSRPRPVIVRTVTTLAFTGLEDMIRGFLAQAAIDGVRPAVASFGVAGPVLGDSARLTNVPWTVEIGPLRQAFGIERATLINDLQAMAYAVPVLEPQELQTIQAGERIDGNMALIAAGTGLGQSLLHRVNGRMIPIASEGGHADYAPRTERDITLLRDLTQRYGRAEVEHVLSGPGLVNIHRVMHASPCTAIFVESGDLPAQITRAAREGRCESCVRTVELFVDAYGAEAGNLAVRSVSTAGCFIGGGIAPKILPALTNGQFIEAFLSKGAMRGLLERMPVHVILNEGAGLLGAATHASQMAGA